MATLERVNNNAGYNVKECRKKDSQKLLPATAALKGKRS
jgi:hypothetical protein